MRPTPGDVALAMLPEAVVVGKAGRFGAPFSFGTMPDNPPAGPSDSFSMLGAATHTRCGAAARTIQLQIDQECTP